MNEDKTNYFVVSRDLLHSNRWLSEKFTRGQAWVDLFGLAQHTDGYFRVRGIRVDLKRGQLGYSQLTLSKRWKWSRNKIKRYLKELENDGDVKQQTIQQITTIITLVHYDKWQLKKTTNDTTNDTTEGQQKDNRRVTYNKKENDKNDNKDTKATEVADLNSLIELFKNVNPSYKTLYSNKTQRDCLARLLKELGREKLVSAIQTLEQTNSMDFAPVITTPFELEKKLGSLIAFVKKQKKTKPIII